MAGNIALLCTSQVGIANSWNKKSNPREAPRQGNGNGARSDLSQEAVHEVGQLRGGGSVLDVPHKYFAPILVDGIEEVPLQVSALPIET